MESISMASRTSFARQTVPRVSRFPIGGTVHWSFAECGAERDRVHSARGVHDY